MSGSRSYSSHDWRWAAPIIISIGAGLRLLDLGGKSLWRDEIETLVFSLASWQEILRRAFEIPVIPIPPLYFFVSRIFLVFGRSPFWLRLPAALSSIAAIVLLYALARRWADSRTAATAALLLAVSPFQLYYAQEARSYAFFMALSLLSLWLMDHWLDDPRPPLLAAWAATAAAVLYTHHFGVIVVGSQAVLGPLLMLIEKNRRRDDRRWYVWFPAAVAAVILLWQPILVHLVSGATGPRGVRGLALAPRFSAEQLASMLGLMGLGIKRGALLLAPMALIGLFPRPAFRLRSYLFCVSWLGSAAVIILFGRYDHVFRVRYLIFVIPIYLLLAARAARVIDGWLEGFSSRCGGRSIRPWASIALVAFSLLWAWPYHWGYFTEEKQNWQAAAAFIKEAAGPGDVVVVTGRGEETNLRRFIMDYYAGLGPRTVILHLSENYLEEAKRQIPAGAAFWYVSTEPRDPELKKLQELFRSRIPRAGEQAATSLAPIYFGTGSRLTPLEAEFLAFARFKPVKVFSIRPGALTNEEIAAASRRLLRTAQAIPRSHVDPGPSLSFLESI